MAGQVTNIPGPEAGTRGGDVAGTRDGAVIGEVAGLSEGSGATLDFEQVYAEHFELVWRSVRRLGVPEASVDDAVQDVFVVVHRQLATFEGRSSLRSWLFGIVRWVVKDHRRRARRKEQGHEELPAGGLPDPEAATPAEAMARAQAVETLYALLGALADDKREVLVMAELEQMSAPEIAGALGINVNTVYSRLRAARGAFNEAVARHQARAHRGPR